VLWVRLAHEAFVPLLVNVTVAGSGVIEEDISPDTTELLVGVEVFPFVQYSRTSLSLVPAPPVVRTYETTVS
jgi:hypothetical protein